MSDTALVTDIQGFCVNDGPGIRTNVFLKGCPLHCLWCHNPETQSDETEVYWKKFKCTQCGLCMDACPKEAIEPPVSSEEACREGATYHKIRRDRCDNCLACVLACPTQALEAVGTAMTPEQIVAEVARDAAFYRNSGGGVTISGGEPAMHPEFVERVLKECRGKGINTCLDTSGHCEWKKLDRMLEEVDVVLYDLKHLDDDVHKKLTGSGNKLVLENLKRIVEKGKRVWLRVLVLPEYSDFLVYHERVVAFLETLPQKVERVDLISFHNWCQDKYGWLGKPWPMGDAEAIDPTLTEVLMEPYEEAGCSTNVGGSGFEPAQSTQGLERAIPSPPGPDRSA